MPFINVMTNSEIKDKNALKSELGNAITAIPGKSEAWLMVKLEDKADMYFKGSDEPYALSNPHKLTFLPSRKLQFQT